MENLSHALYMAAAMFAFVLAFSVALVLVNKLDAAAETITYKLDGSYYDSFSLERILGNNNDNSNRSRVVGLDTIIPTLYRYYKESFAVKILDVDGTLLQYFDTTTEGDVNAAKVTQERTTATSDRAEILKRNKQKALLSLYDVGDTTVPQHCCYMFGVPWLANINKDAKTRVDMYINGGKGYINNVLVDYSQPIGQHDSRLVSLNNFQDRKFREVFTQYAYEGDTVTNDENEIVTLTGSKQIATKIIIIYQLLPI